METARLIYMELSSRECKKVSLARLGRLDMY